ncbi:MAG: ATP-dependent sacrificial sulfur transferase LarE [Methanomassiliicoccales archaeon]|nr:ATP-dependent sacrificial sulfur transferase LarE [Methanomassiliicoccales archaeon]
MSEADEKYQRLVESIAALGKVAVAFSGGADSTLLLKAALDSGAEVTAFMAVGDIFFAEEQKSALALAQGLGVEVLMVRLDLLNDERFLRNWEDRCYICKTVMFQRIRKECERRGIEHILEGSNLDDLKRMRPGRTALVDLRVRSPLQEARLGKGEVRELLQEKGIPNWDTPSNTCLATRVPYDVRITPKILARVEWAERLLSPFHFERLRVRDHGNWVRIEVAPQDIPRLFELRAQVLELLRPLGYARVSLDLDGYSH